MADNELDMPDDLAMRRGLLRLTRDIRHVRERNRIPIERLTVYVDGVALEEDSAAGVMLIPDGAARIRVVDQMGHVRVEDDLDVITDRPHNGVVLHLMPRRPDGAQELMVSVEVAAMKAAAKTGPEGELEPKGIHFMAEPEVADGHLILDVQCALWEVGRSLLVTLDGTAFRPRSIPRTGRVTLREPVNGEPDLGGLHISIEDEA